MEHLRANVVRVTGATKHYEGAILEDGTPAAVTEMPAPAYVEIEGSMDDGYHLILYTATGEFAGDTWHETVQEAKGQAAFAYCIPEDAWRPVQ